MLAIIAQDAVPVYLAPSTGKILVNFANLSALVARRKQQEDPNGQGILDYKPRGQAQGATRKDKDRLSWICRQGLSGVGALKPGERPKGEIRDSYLVVPCAQCCQLDDMSTEEPAVWTRTHTLSGTRGRS